ncbi:chemotaxis protein CheW [Anthocerotibacter panamensis]|uniref:chemotaxis protein CheW n=1 Tax=Anthocerotibacter panamensis TaxID=2857077 RepID=UPI001C4055D9|nr:chemotaxis protein CheW [Anthocerotibacter panamensis]
MNFSPAKPKTRLKLVVFPIQQVNLALRIEHVQRVIPCPEVLNTGGTAVGIITLADRAVPVLDLHQRLYPAHPETAPTHLVLAQTQGGEDYGIPVTETPTLLEVSLEYIRTLPPSYRRSTTLGLASHVAVVPQEHGSLTIFLLDADQLLNFN